MKAGAEIHFLSGQLFMLGVAILAIAPRLPFDDTSRVSLGGQLSYPFRRALLSLIAIGVFRTLSCHLHHPESKVLALTDVVLGTIQVLGQTFLCLTTAYILQFQMQNFVNIEGGRPGRSLMPTFIFVLLSTVTGSFLSLSVHPNWWCLESLAEAASCFPVLRTINTYASVTTGQNHGRGSVLLQTLKLTEYWYLSLALLNFFAEAIDTLHGDVSKLEEDQWFALRVLLEATRSNQDNGIDDYVRLLVHAIFLNSLDELQHFSRSFEHSSTSDDDDDDDDIENTPGFRTGSLARRR